MRPDMRWAGEGRLQVNAYDHPPVDLTGARLSFIPTLSRDGWICLDAPHRYVVVYPVRGLPRRSGRHGRTGGAEPVARAGTRRHCRTPPRCRSRCRTSASAR
jgi:hypothetical protein